MRQRALLIGSALRQLDSYAQIGIQKSAAISSCSRQLGATSGTYHGFSTAGASLRGIPPARPSAPRQYGSAAQEPENPAVSEAARHGGGRAVSLEVPTFMVWGANTDVGKTLVSAGLAAAAVRAQARPKPSNMDPSAYGIKPSCWCIWRASAGEMRLLHGVGLGPPGDRAYTLINP